MAEGVSDRVRSLPVRFEAASNGSPIEAAPAAGSGLLRSIAQKAVGLVIRVLTLGSSDGWPIDNPSEAGEKVNEGRLLTLSAAWACVNLLAGVTGTLPFNVWRKDPKTGIPVQANDHWLQALFDSPNADQTIVDMLEFLAVSLELRGNSYFEKRRLDSGRVIALEPMPPDTEVRRLDSGRLQYRFSGLRGEPRALDQDDVWHIRGFGGSPLGGLSTIAFGAQAFGLSLALERSAASTFRNGIRPSGILKFKDWLKPEKREAAHAKLREDHSNATNSGKPLVLEGGVEWQQISFSPQDSQMLESRSFSVEDICRWFQVPPVLVGHTAKVSAWGTGILEITLGFVKYGLRRRLKRIEKSADKQLLSAADRAAGYFCRFDIEGLLRGSPKERAEFYEKMGRNGYFSIDYVRGLENLPPLPGGVGAMPRIQSQNVEVGADPEPKAPPPPAAEEE